MDLHKVGTGLAGGMAAGGLLASAGPWAAAALVLCVFFYKAKDIAGGIGKMRVYFACARRIGEGDFTVAEVLSVLNNLETSKPRLPESIAKRLSDEAK
jgi:hypothetical protein